MYHNNHCSINNESNYILTRRTTICARTIGLVGSRLVSWLRRKAPPINSTALQQHVAHTIPLATASAFFTATLVRLHLPASDERPIPFAAYVDSEH